jgi:hypothetical protein
LQIEAVLWRVFDFEMFCGEFTEEEAEIRDFFTNITLCPMLMLKLTPSELYCQM